MKSANTPELAVVAAPQAQALEQRRTNEAFDIEGMFKYALDKAAGPEAMTTLMNIRRELNSEASKKSFDEALSAFQAECPVIIKTKAVPTKEGKTAYKFAPIEKVEEVIRPIERKYGFSHTFDTDVTSQPGWVIASCIVTHSLPKEDPRPSGHTRTSSIKLPLGGKTQIMSDTQVYAGALTFANRRALANVYGLVIAGEDIDGADNKPRPSGPATIDPKASTVSADPLKKLKNDLWAVTQKIHNGDPKALQQWLWDELNLDTSRTLESLNAAELQGFIAIAKRKLNV